MATATAWGTVGADGKALNHGSGTWSSLRQSTGVYRIRLEQSTGGTLAVVVSGHRLEPSSDNDPGQDNTYSTRVLSNVEFEAYSYDTGQEVKGKPQDAAFSFIAMWQS